VQNQGRDQPRTKEDEDRMEVAMSASLRAPAPHDDAFVTRSSRLEFARMSGSDRPLPIATHVFFFFLYTKLCVKSELVSLSAPHEIECWYRPSFLDLY
jgi:hypothetical protein